jgi:hypothetical protein
VASKLAATAALLVLLGSGAATAADAWSFGAQLDADYDGNAGSAGASHDVRSTQRLGGGVNATYMQRWGLFTALELRGALDGADDLDIGGLSFLRAATRVRLLHKPGQSFHVPVLAAWGTVGRRDYRSAIRDSADYRGGVSLAEPINTAVQARLEATVMRRDASTRVFDQREKAIAASLDWNVASWFTLYGGYRIASGDIVITAEGGGIVPKNEHHYLYAYAEAVEPDDAFGPDWNAFRVPARTHVASLGVNVPLGADLALDAQLQHARAEADVGDGSAFGYPGGIRYDRTLGGVSLLMRF